MSKITDDKKLPLGVSIEPSHVAGNLQDVGTVLSGAVTADQRTQSQAPFSISWFFAQTAGGAIGTAAGESLHFTLPPLQDEWNDKLVSDENTKAITLDSISFGFDLMNQKNLIDNATGLPGSVEMNSVTLRLYKLTNNPGLSNPPPEKVLMAELVVTAEEIAFGQNTRNPGILRDLGVSIDRYAVYEWHLDSPGQALFSVTIRASFSHPVVQRDTSVVLGNALNSGTPVDAQNAPLTALYNKDNDTVSITAPGADTLIQADAVTTGVQTQIETLDTKFRNQLVGGRAGRYQSDKAFATDRKEQLVEDSGYFCMCVNLMKLGTDGMITGTNADKYEVADATGVTLWDRALIPISYPGTIHHVFIEAAGINDYIRKNPGAVAISNRRYTVGVGLHRGVRVSVPTYQQVAFGTETLTSTTGNILQNRLWAVPLVYSTAGGSVAGKGFVPQGRPVYFGRQLTYDGAVNREPIADSVASSSAEGVPNTGGYENFIEVRLSYTRGSGHATWKTGAAADLALSNAGFNVYIIGKMGLKE